MIYTVTLNPSLDYIVTLDRLEAGAVNRTKHEVINPGGKGINVSLVLGNLGIESVALGFIAGFTGDEIEKRLQNLGIKTDFIRLKEGQSRINMKVRAGEETEINGLGPVIGADEFAALMAQLDSLASGDTLVLAGSIPSSLSSSVYSDILKHLEGRGIRVVVDATKALLMNALPYHPFLIKPNHHELGEIFGVSIKTQEEAAIYGQKLQALGAKNVLVSMAGEGAVLIAADGQVMKAKAPRGKVINSVGAGDSMVAGFLAGLAENGDLAEAFAMGVCTGSASAFAEGMADKESVKGLLFQVKNQSQNA